jgi:hypothetical protein
MVFTPPVYDRRRAANPSYASVVGKGTFRPIPKGKPFYPVSKKHSIKGRNIKPKATTNHSFIYGEPKSSYLWRDRRRVTDRPKQKPKSTSSTRKNKPIQRTKRTTTLRTRSKNGGFRYYAKPINSQPNLTPFHYDEAAVDAALRRNAVQRNFTKRTSRPRFTRNQRRRFALRKQAATSRAKEVRKNELIERRVVQMSRHLLNVQVNQNKLRRMQSRSRSALEQMNASNTLVLRRVNVIINLLNALMSESDPIANSGVTRHQQYHSDLFGTENPEYCEPNRPFRNQGHPTSPSSRANQVKRAKSLDKKYRTKYAHKGLKNRRRTQYVQNQRRINEKYKNLQHDIAHSYHSRRKEHAYAVTITDVDDDGNTLVSDPTRAYASITNTDPPTTVVLGPTPAPQEASTRAIGRITPTFSTIRTRFNDLVERARATSPIPRVSMNLHELEENTQSSDQSSTTSEEQQNRNEVVADSHDNSSTASTEVSPRIFELQAQLERANLEKLIDGLQNVDSKQRWRHRERCEELVRNIFDQLTSILESVSEDERTAVAAIYEECQILTAQLREMLDVYRNDNHKEVDEFLARRIH